MPCASFSMLDGPMQNEVKIIHIIVQDQDGQNNMKQVQKHRKGATNNAYFAAFLVLKYIIDLSACKLLYFVKRCTTLKSHLQLLHMLQAARNASPSITLITSTTVNQGRFTSYKSFHQRFHCLPPQIYREYSLNTILTSFLCWHCDRSDTDFFIFPKTNIPLFVLCLY